jgi:8-oxo-dGTP pyrophosphatase MutT (NUDIX family)
MQRAEQQAGAAAGVTTGPALKPQDAATLIILDTFKGSPRILFGKRRMDQKFMPGKYVFPGGRVDASDMRLALGDDLGRTELSKLAKMVKGKPSQRRLNGLGLAAIRETFEETGLIIGRRNGARPPRSGSPVWTRLLSHGLIPHLSAVTFLARAITPPGRPRRYDTRFFCIAAQEIGSKIDSQDGELTELHWLTLEEAKTFDLPTIQQAVLEDLKDRLKSGQIAPGDHPVPFYHMYKGAFRRDLLTADRREA